MTNPRLKIKVYNKQGPNGDRATVMTPYKTWEITYKEFVIQEFDEYDDFYCSIDTTGTTRAEMKGYVHNLTKALGFSSPLWVRMQKKEITKVEWIETKILHEDDNAS